METITQRQLRNDNATVVKAVMEGESFIVTRNGTPVARISPYEGQMPERVMVDDMPPLSKPAIRPFSSANHKPIKAHGLTNQEILDELRADRL